MSRFNVNLNEAAREPKMVTESKNTPNFHEYQKPKKRSVFVKVLGILGIVLAAVILIGTIGGYFYWQSLKKTPQYSLALLIDAARRDDQKAIDRLVDTDAIIEDFVPQITGKAVELYGRNLPPQTIAKVAQIAAPLMPAVKERARAEIPNLIRDKTKKLENVPFWAIAAGADRFLDITQESDTAFVKSKLQDRPLELSLKLNGDKWQVVGVKDDELAKRVAEKIGQELILLAQKRSLKKAGESFGIGNLSEVLKQLDGIFK
jgi:hypothetical protein